MRIVFKILLAPAWLLLAVLKLAFRLAVGSATFISRSAEGCYRILPQIIHISLSLTGMDLIKNLSNA